jgi:hypothetical protein
MTATKKTKRSSRSAPIANPAVAKTFANYPPKLRAKLLSLRQLILDTASELKSVGPLEETLKWNEPAYLTNKSKSGSTIRINRQPGSDTRYAIYFNCHTTLVDTFRTLYPNAFTYEGNRALIFDINATIAKKELQACISMALTYHRNKK